MFRKGNIPWNKGKKCPQISFNQIGNKNHMWGKHPSEKTKKKMSLSHKDNQKGSKNPGWNGGKWHKDGYVYIHKPNHPKKGFRNYVKRSNLIMEKHLGRYLKPKEIVHHRNEIRDDDRIENLRLFPNLSKHMQVHNLIRRNSSKETSIEIQ